ncbi:MAG TPA: protein kinase [Streptosporangiaceae bacterium]|nr:protein kinase [Streptosporangiaceae bacterium]
MHPSADTGRVIAGRYRLQAPLGRGAMGVVWQARDQLLDRDVAIKEVQIADSLTEEERATAFQRTLREAKTAARLNHPAVVTVYDVAEDGGRPWIVMQLVNAQSLDQVLASSGPLSPRRAAEMARQLLSALSVAHAAGVMHRDVKPSNVLIGANDQAVLTDFGIATFADDPKLTQTGMVMGSPGFTAPERIRGEDASPASDLWSLGATIYAAVEGHGPFERRGGAMTTMSAIINENAPAAPTAGALGPVIAALLRREPEDRPDASAAERMIANVLPQLDAQASDAPPGYAPTALSASSRPAVPPRPSAPPRPGETALDFGSADRALAKDPPAERTGPPAGVQAQAAQTTPSSAQPGQGDPPRHEPPAGGWGQGYAAPAGYPPPGSAGAPAGYAPGGAAGSAARPEGGRGDFSSWYDPAPRPGASPGSGPAWSGSSAPQSPAPGSGYPAPAGYGPAGNGPAGWPGQSSQPAPSTPPWSGAEYAPSRRRRSGMGWKAAVAALAIIGAGAGAATVVLLHHGNSGSPQNGSSSSAPPSTSSTRSGGGTGSTLPPVLLTAAINQPLTGPPPAGYKNLTEAATGKESVGFTINYPSDWTVAQKGAYQTWLYGPQSGVNMLVDLTPHTYPSDMVQEAQYIETQSIPHFPGYQRIDLKALTIRGTPGSFWKFTWMDNGVKQEALDFLFIQDQQSYALYATAPASMWNQMQSVFDEEVRSFAPK